MLCSMSSIIFFFFFFNDTATTEIYTLSLHDALPLVLGELAERLLRLPIARRLRAGEKVRERNVHGLGDFGQRSERGHGVPVFDARKVAAQEPGPAPDAARRQAPLAPIGFTDSPEV